MLRRWFLLLALVPVALGCSEAKHKSPSVEAITFAGGGGENDYYSRGDGGDKPTSELANRADVNKAVVAFDGQNASTGGDKKPELTRKMIQTATVYLVVEKFDDGEAQLREVIKQHGGRISGSDTQGSVGAQRTGRYKVRVPVEKFEAFRQAVEKIGNLERSTVESREVTEEYYDTQARLKNKTTEEKRLIDHLEKTTGKLSDILDVEKELSRVRGEIEQLQGRLNLLENLTSLTTVDVYLREVKNYTPPTAATFGEEVSRTLDYSSSMLVRTGKSIALNAISILPWLPVWIVLGLLLYRPLRGMWRWMKTSNRARFETVEA